MLEQGAKLVQRSVIPDGMIDGEKVGELEGSYAEKVRQSVCDWGRGGHGHDVAYTIGQLGGEVGGKRMAETMGRRSRVAILTTLTKRAGTGAKRRGGRGHGDEAGHD